jgi:aminoglycoside phosphotransferase (APT) family kinase protein
VTDKTTTPLQEAQATLAELGLKESPRRHNLQSSHSSSVPLACEGKDGRTFLLKWFLPQKLHHIYPAGARPEDFARREAGFYRLLDSIDPDRRDLPTPRTILVGPGDPPRWLLLEWLQGAPGPAEEVLLQDHVLELLRRLQSVPTDRLLGRRDFPLNHWDPIGYLERIRLMYDAVLNVLGEPRWRHLLKFFDEAVRWLDGRKPVLVHGDFVEANIVVDTNDRPHLLDFERVGMGNSDHDFATFWIHSTRSHEWKKSLLMRWLGNGVGGDRIRSEWGIRTALALLAVQRLRWGFLTYGDEDQRVSANLALLDAAIEGGKDLFPR